MLSAAISRLFILVFGTLYPSYASYKAIKNKNIKEYARWMMFWVSFGLFSFIEIFADILFGFWLPFYYEIKIIFILWLMSPYGNGARIMYKNVIHPEFNRRELVIDSYIEQAKEVGVSSVWHIWSKASEVLNIAILNVIQMAQAAILHHMESTGSSRQEPRTSPLGFARGFASMYLTSAPSHAALPSSASGHPLNLQQGPSARDCFIDETLEFYESDVSSNVSSNVHIGECIEESAPKMSSSFEDDSRMRRRSQEPDFPLRSAKSSSSLMNSLEPKAKVRRRRLESKGRPAFPNSNEKHIFNRYN